VDEYPVVIDEEPYMIRIPGSWFECPSWWQNFVLEAIITGGNPDSNRERIRLRFKEAGVVYDGTNLYFKHEKDFLFLILKWS